LRRLIKVIEYPYSAFEAIFFAKRVNAKIAHIQSVNEIEVLFILLLKFFGFKIVYTTHNTLPRHKNFGFINFRIFKYIYRLSDHLIIHTNRGKHELMQLFNITPQKISVIPHGNYDFFLPHDEHDHSKFNRLKYELSHFKTLLFFGAIRPNKGLDALIKILPLIVRQIPETKLIIAGELGENYDKYRALIRDYKMQDNIIEFLEYISNDDVAFFFNTADIVVLPYYEVTSSGVLQIAYSFGKPVVTSDLPGFNEFVDDGKNGFSVPIYQSDKFADAVCLLLKDSKLRDVMGRHSRQLSMNKYSWADIALNTIHIYQDLAN
jgi:glycosyltransferase involved in cell wall biosynthesis